MIAPLAKLLDWLAIQVVALTEPAKAFNHNARLEEALQFLKGPDFIPMELNWHRLNSTDLSTSAFLHLDHASSYGNSHAALRSSL